MDKPFRFAYVMSIVCVYGLWSDKKQWTSHSSLRMLQALCVYMDCGAIKNDGQAIQVCIRYEHRVCTDDRAIKTMEKPFKFAYITSVVCVQMVEQ